MTFPVVVWDVVGDALDPLPWHGGRKETKENMAIVPDDSFKEC